MLTEAQKRAQIKWREKCKTDMSRITIYVPSTKVDTYYAMARADRAELKKPNPFLVAAR